MLTDEALCKLDLYVFIDVTPQASKAEIKKAFKVKARDVHPDKNPDPKAGELFDKLHTIYNFLRDDKKREMYDKLRQQQALRKRKLEEEDSGRKNLRKELERREEAFRLAKLKENKLSDAERTRLQTEKKIEEMIKQGHLPSSSLHGNLPSASPSPSSAFASKSAFPSATATTATNPLNSRTSSRSSKPEGSSASISTSATVVIAWEQKKVKEEWQVDLRLMLEQYGQVGDLIVNKRKALAVFATSSQAAAAVSANQDHPDLKFKLKPGILVEDEEVQISTGTQAKPVPSALHSSARYDDDYEAQTLQLLLRRQKEKQREV